MEQSQHRFEPFLAALRELSFVARTVVAKPRPQETGDLAATISDRRGRQYRFRGEFRSSYLDRPSVHAVVANALQHQRDGGCPTLVFARYVPLPTAEQFLEAGVNFVDLAGNLHLVLGDRYERTIMGRAESQKSKESHRITPAQLQVLFLFATQPESVAWPVREIGTQAGVSKSKAASVRSGLIADGLVAAKTGPNPFSRDEGHGGTPGLRLFADSPAQAGARAIPGTGARPDGLSETPSRSLRRQFVALRA